MGFERRYKPLGRTETALGSIDTLSDVTITSATTGDLLRFDGAAWINYPDSNYAAASHNHLESEITDGALLARLADTETITGSWTFNSQVTLGDGDSTSGDILLYFNIDRAWSFETFGADASADLSLVAQTNGKFFNIRDAADIAQFQFLTINTTPYFRVYDALGTDYGQFSHNGTYFDLESANTTAYRVHDAPLWVLDGKEIRVYDVGLTDYVSTFHNGSIGLLSTNAGDLVLQATDTGVIRTATGNAIHVPGSYLRIIDPGNTDYAQFSHDGTDFNTTFTNTVDHNMYGLTGAFKFKNAAQNDIFLVDFANSLVDVHDGYALRIRNSGDTDYADFSHNGTDFYLSLTNTNWWRVDGITNGILLQDGPEVRIYDDTNADYVAFVHDGTDLNTTFVGTTNWNVSIPFVSTASGFRDSAGLQVRAAEPELYLYDTNAAADEKGWGVRSTTGQFLISTSTDAGAFGQNAFKCDRSGTAAASMELTANGILLQSNSGEKYVDCVNNADVALHYNSVETARTLPVASGGFQVNNTSTGAGWERVLTTSDLGGGGGFGDPKVKTATTSRSSTTTFADDPHLLGWSLTANKHYAVIGHLTYIAANTTPDIKFDWVWTNAPADAGDWGLLQTDDAKVLQEADSESPMTTAMVALDIASREQTAWIHGHFKANATTGGTVDFQWAQNTSSATATQLLAGSWISLVQLD